MPSISVGGIACTAGPVRLRRLARQPHRVGRYATPLDRPLQDALEHRHRLADRLDPDARRLEVGAEARDRLRRELAQLQVAEPRQRVAVPEARVAPQGRPLQVRAGVERPPLLDELDERLATGVEIAEGVGALERADLGLERPRVRCTVERLAALGAGLVVPADAPDRVGAPVTTAALALLHHARQPVTRRVAGASADGGAGRAPSPCRPMPAVRRSRPVSSRPRAAGRRGPGAAAAARRAGVTMDASIHMSTSALRMR